MSKVAIIADTHLGVHSDDTRYLDHQVSFFRDTFFPEIDRRGVSEVIHLGDLVDRRKYVNFNTARTLRREFLEPLAEKRVFTHVICGNHDVSFKNTNEVNALTELVSGRYPSIKVYTETERVEVGGLPVLLVPWICRDNQERTMHRLSTTDSRYCMGHLELSGFKMYKSSQESHGLDPSVFKRFDAVLSGHYHHRSSRGNVLYVGAPYEMTWADHDDERGFHVLDTETLDLEYVRNDNPLHVKLLYDESSVCPEGLENKVVKLIVRNREDGKAYDDYVRKLEGQSPADVQVVEDNLHLDLSPSEEDEPVMSEDTSDIIRSAIDEIEEEDVDKTALADLLMDVYSEAVNRR